MLWDYKMKRRPLKIIIFLLVAIFLLANFSSGSQETCVQDCLECQKIVTNSCCQNSMTESTPSLSSTNHSSQNSCNHGQFCEVTKEHTNLLISSSSQTFTFSLQTSALSTLETPLNTRRIVSETIPINHIYTDIQLHILHCSFII